MDDTLTTPDTLNAFLALSKGDRPWQRRLRLLQSIWREERGLEPGMHQGEPLGSRLEPKFAEAELPNYLTDTVRKVVRRELGPSEGKATGKLYSKPRIFDDLLSSQPLCFNFFAELEDDLDAASAWARHLWPGRVQRVTKILFEHSPGRGDHTYLGTKTAFDVYLEHTTPEKGRGFIGIEVKYHEDLRVKAAKVTATVQKAAAASNAFVDPRSAELQRPPLQQLWFDHLLVLSMLQAEAGTWGENGLYVVMHPVANQACYAVLGAYERQLKRPSTFQRLTLEEAVASLQLTVSRPWVDELYRRYLDPNPGIRVTAALAKRKARAR